MNDAVNRRIVVFKLEMNGKEFYNFRQSLIFFLKDVEKAKAMIRGPSDMSILSECKTVSGNEEDEANLCYICMFQKESVILPCGHGLCMKCAEDWLGIRKKKDCPFCRCCLVGGKSYAEQVYTIVESDLEDSIAKNKKVILGLLKSRFTLSPAFVDLINRIENWPNNPESQKLNKPF